MNVRGLFLFLSLLTILFFAGSALAARPEAPPTVAIDVTAATSWLNAGVPQYSGTVNVTFLLSPDDPDQSAGDPTYTEYVTGLSPGTLTVSPAARAGWVYYSTSYGPFTDATAIVTWNITWNDGSGAEGESAPSCEVTIDFRILGDHDQCDPESLGTPRAPTGLNGIIVEELTPTEGRTDLRWTVSQDDPDQAQGDFTYVVRFRNDDYPEGTYSENDDPTDASDADGIRYYMDEYGGGASFVVTYDVFAKDPRTRLWSGYSCAIMLDQDAIHYQDSCGNLTVPDVTLNPGGPQFPLVNVTAGAEAFGLSTVTFGLILGAGTILAGAALGFATAGPVGAGVMGTVAVAFAAALNLFPAWAIVVLFLAAVGIAVTFWTRGGSS